MTDIELIARVVAGDAAAERELYDSIGVSVALNGLRKTKRIKTREAPMEEGMTVGVVPVEAEPDLKDRMARAIDAVGQIQDGIRDARCRGLHARRGSIGRKAIFPATIADSAEIWPTLIKIARNPDLPRESRTQSVFWLGQAAGDAATANLNSLVLDNSVDREIREQAVFALSQRPRDEGVPALIAVAKTNKDPEIRKKACSGSASRGILGRLTCSSSC
ncbi:MAG TPA: hypothetical protein VIM36_08025 [Gemmatimonadaceae bacterium]